MPDNNASDYQDTPFKSTKIAGKTSDGKHVPFKVGPDGGLAKDLQKNSSFVSETNLAASTYRYIFDLADYQNYGIQWSVSGGVTIEHFLTLDDTADDSADTGWIQDTDFGTQVDNDGLFERDTPTTADRGMVKITTSDATNSISVILSRSN
jgi:hypothetical protein